MAAISSSKIPGFDNSHIKIKARISSFPCPQLFIANLSHNCEAFKLSRWRISCGRNKPLVRSFRAPSISCLLEDDFVKFKETKHSSFVNNFQQEAAIDLKLPRRSLLVTFTCNACGARSQRLISRLAYERGLVYVQCSGCSRYHKLVDNLGLVVEYKLQDEIELDASTDHV